MSNVSLDTASNPQRMTESQNMVISNAISDVKSRNQQAPEGPASCMKVPKTIRKCVESATSAFENNYGVKKAASMTSAVKCTRASTRLPEAGKYSLEQANAQLMRNKALTVGKQAALVKMWKEGPTERSKRKNTKLAKLSMANRDFKTAWRGAAQGTVGKPVTAHLAMQHKFGSPRSYVQIDGSALFDTYVVIRSVTIAAIGSGWFWLDDHFPEWGISEVETFFFTVVGLCLSFLLVFKSNVAYSRFWEARGHVGTICNGLRSLMRNLCFVAEVQHPRDDKPIKTIQRYNNAFFELFIQDVRMTQDLIHGEVDAPCRARDAQCAYACLCWGPPHRLPLKPAVLSACPCAWKMRGEMTVN